LLPQNDGDIMRWFEQAISKRRYHLMQFHCPAMLKLERLHKKEMDACVRVHTLAWVFFIALHPKKAAGGRACRYPSK